MGVMSSGSTAIEAQGMRKAIEMYEVLDRQNWSAKLVLSFSGSAVSKMRSVGHYAYADGFEAGSLIVAQGRMRVNE
jgi:hypothetical protein